ncbi:MAG: C2H2-type zinc finger protein [Nitrosotalea sp.]
MTKLYLSEEAFRTLVRISKEIGVPQSELVSELILNYAKTPAEQREEPQHKCGLCSLSFFSNESLEHHMERHAKTEVSK